MLRGALKHAPHDHMMMVRATRGLNSSAEVAPVQAGRPFDRGATGIVPGEGSAVLVLERESTARARGAKIYAELAGYGEWFAPPATREGVQPGPEATIRSMAAALKMAGADSGDVDVVAVHGESRNDLDALEASALAESLGSRVSEVPVMALAAHVGSVEAAVGPMGAALVLQALETGKVPGALNRQDPLPEYQGPTSSESVTMDARLGVVSLTTREGVSSALVFRKLEN